MTGWLKLTDEQRRATLAQAQQLSGISAKALEKDWWVTLVLKALFQSGYAAHMVFKGGTSLSKGYKLINRFSEDIDIALASEAFDITYEQNPTTSYLKRLRKKGYEFSTTKLVEELRIQLLELGVSEAAVTIVFEPSPENQTPLDPQTIYVKYKSLYDPNKYIADQVKIEVSVRSLQIPFTGKPIQSILSEFFPNKAYEEKAFVVTIVEPRKTFLEKAFLLHEEFSKADKTTIRTERMSRHFYDLVAMKNKIAADALADHDLYDNLVNHRKKYINTTWADYSTLVHSKISFIPSNDILEAYKRDYQEMLENMIHGENPPSYDELVEQLKLIQGRFRLKREVKQLEEIIKEATKSLEPVIEEKPYLESYSVTVVDTSDSAGTVKSVKTTKSFQVRFIQSGGRLIFEDISVLEN